MRVPLTTVAEELSDVQEEPSQYFTNTAFQSLKPGLMEGSELKKEGGVGCGVWGFEIGFEKGT
jgi:hypothetical protein